MSLSIMSRARTFVTTRLFGKYLFLTNSVTCGCLLAAGDVVQQTVERTHTKKDYSFQRTGRMFFIGMCVIGPLNHCWYSLFLDRILPGRTTRIVIKKIVLDQTMASPFFAFCFLTGMNMLEGHTFKQGVAEFKSKFVTLYLVDLCVWPPAQFINFFYVPPTYRVLCVNFITLGWDVFLSFIKHNDFQITFSSAKHGGSD